MAKAIDYTKPVAVRLVPDQIDIILGMLGVQSLEMAKKLSAASDPKEREFYATQLGKFETLTGVIEARHPRLRDTSQDAEADEDADSDE